MKILHIINSLNIGGAEVLITELALEAKKNGNTFDIAIFNLKDKELYNKLIKNGIKVYIFNTSRFSLKNFFYFMKLSKKYDIIHTHLFPANYWGVILKIFNKKIKLVTTEHSTYNKRRKYFFFRVFDKIIYKQYDGIIFISKAVKENLLEWLKLKNCKSRVIFNGINIEKFKNSIAYNKQIFFDENSIILIMVSNFSIQKKQETIIKALQFLPDNIKLLLVGDGDRKEEMIQLTKDLSLEDKIKFLGKRYDVPNLLKTSDIVIQSSLWEGFGISVIEGMAAGKPVVASNTEGLNQIVKNYGLLFQCCDEKDLATKIRILLNYDNYIKFVNKSKIRAKEFSIEKTLKNYIEFYKNIRAK